MEKKPLYRKDNKTALNYKGNKGGDYSTNRHSKKTLSDDSTHKGMGGQQQRGMDYTPLYRFLFSRVGDDWDTVHSEANARLHKPDPIFYIVALHARDKKSIVRVGESSYWLGLYVDDNNILQIVQPELSIEMLWPYCACCTHSFNGKPFVNKYEPEKSTVLSEINSGK